MFVIVQFQFSSRQVVAQRPTGRLLRNVSSAVLIPRGSDGRNISIHHSPTYELSRKVLLEQVLTFTRDDRCHNDHKSLVSQSHKAFFTLTPTRITTKLDILLSESQSSDAMIQRTRHGTIICSVIVTRRRRSSAGGHCNHQSKSDAWGNAASMCNVRRLFSPS